MEIKTITVSYGRTINLGNFESARLDCTVQAELEPGDDEATVADQLWTMARNNVRAEYFRVKGNPQAAQGVELGLPGRIEKQLPAHVPIATNGNGHEPDVSDADELPF